ncbi:MAG: trehalose-6-phosphate synthase, partial [Elainellaceae cyanobacterium]
TALSEPMMTTKLRYNGQIINLNAFPVGTDPDHVRKMVAKPEVKARAAEIRNEIGDGKLIVSAGRVDYVKGTKELLSCYKRLLERRPELQGKVHLVLTAAAPNKGMRVYRTAKKEIEQWVGKINGKFGTLNWTPVKLFTTPLPFDDLMAVYSSADIAWITPLRDGLNLVAKEYVVANKGERGILVLSEFAGSAVELPDAILVNPYASYEMDKAIDSALDMPSGEQKQRMGKMYESICRYDVQQWANHMFRAAKAAAVDRETEANGQEKASALV